MGGEQIRITGGPAAGSQIEVGQELQIGRSAAAEGRLGDDPEISRQHARITRNPQGQLVVEDVGSTNGTYVNGQRISGPTTLNPGDTLQMGRSTLSVEGGAAGGQATAIGAVPAGFPPQGQAAPPPPPPPAPPPVQAGGPGGPGYGPGPGPGPVFPTGAGAPGGPPKSNTGRIALIGGLIAAVVVAAVVLAIVLSGGDDGKDKSTTSSQAAQSTPTTFTMDTSSIPTTEPATTESTPTDTQSTPSTGGDYPANVKKQFVQGCVNGGGSESACQCTIDEIEKKYNLVEFLQIINEANSSGKFPSGVQTIIRKCASA
jgi:hypothetical protein